MLTRNPGYRKKRALKANRNSFIKRAYKKYPNLVRAIMTRNAVYNRQMNLIEKLEEEGKNLCDPSTDPDRITYGEGLR